jgi:uncharacterized protein (TIGR02271 family)
MTQAQQSTIIAIFSDASAAQAAARDLLSIGISRENMYLESGRADMQSGAATSDPSQTDDGLGTSMPAHQGGVGGWFKSLFGGEDEDTGTRYQQAVGRGNVILSVHAREDQYEQIADVLERHHPIDIDEETQTTGARGAVRADANATANTGSAIPVVEEALQVGKRRVLRGGVRVYSRVVERPVEESINLTEDHVRVDRRAADRPATEADFRSGKDGAIEMQEFAEEAVVGKTARVVEEVRVGKETTQRTENIRDSVRRTEVDVEPIAAGQGTRQAGTDYDDTDFRNDFQTRYGASGGNYDTYAPAYRYGYQMASDPRYHGRSYDDVESQLRSDYTGRYPESTWEKMKDSVRYGWDKVTGRARAASR